MNFFKRSLAIILVTAMTSFVAACGTPESLSYPPGKTLKITSDVWGAFQEYRELQGGVRKNGFFLVAMHNDVGVGSRWSYCPPSADYCREGGLNLASQMCRDERLTCVLFARGPQIVLPYEIVN
ncbi:hypothetical protein [Dongia sp.]|uniref:hypothetical protein n=1 Tax=Dongia sp. TaxID=1977262 RepID=UPI0035AF49CC